nr:PREDICTED: glycogen debranching enzyme [Bemisia tabaci]
MLVEVGILSIILFIIFWEFNTLSHIFIKFIWQKLTLSESYPQASKARHVSKTEKTKNTRPVKEIQKQGKSLKKEQNGRKEKTKKEEKKVKNKEQKPSKYGDPVSLPDKGVKVTTDKKPTKTLPPPQGPKKDKTLKSKSGDNSGEWTIVQKRMKKSYSSKTIKPDSTGSSVQTRGPNCSELTALGKQSDTSTVTKPHYKERRETIPTINIGRTGSSSKPGAPDPSLIPKPSCTPKNEAITKGNLPQKTATNGTTTRTTNELAQGFFFYKGNKAENDSKQYLDFANQNKRKFQTDYAKTVYKPNALSSEITNGFGSDISDNSKKPSASANQGNSIDSTFVGTNVACSNVGNEPPSEVHSSSNTFVNPNETDSQRLVANPVNFCSSSQAPPIQTTFLNITSSQMLNQTFPLNAADANLIPQIENFDPYRNSVIYSYTEQNQQRVENTSASSNNFSASFPDAGTEIFSYTTYNENFPILYNSSSGFVEMPPDHLTSFANSGENKSYYQENVYHPGEAFVHLDSAGNHFNGFNSNSAHISGLPNKAPLGQFVSSDNAASYRCDINVDEKNYGLSDGNSDEAQHGSPFNPEEVLATAVPTSKAIDESLQDLASPHGLSDAQQESDQNTNIVKEELPRKDQGNEEELSYFAGGEDSLVNENLSSEEEGSDPECERSLSINEGECSEDTFEESSLEVNNLKHEGMPSTADQGLVKSDEDETVLSDDEASEDEIENQKRPLTKEEVIDSAEESTKESKSEATSQAKSVVENQSVQEDDSMRSNEMRNNEEHEVERDLTGSDFCVESEVTNQHTPLAAGENSFIGGCHIQKNMEGKENPQDFDSPESLDPKAVECPHTNYFELQSNEDISKILGKNEDAGMVSSSLVESSGSLRSKIDELEVDEDKLIAEQLSDALLDESETSQPAIADVSPNTVMPKPVVSAENALYNIMEEPGEVEEKCHAEASICKEPSVQAIDQNLLPNLPSNETFDKNRTTPDSSTQLIFEHSESNPIISEKFVNDEFSVEVTESLSSSFDKKESEAAGSSKGRPQKMVTTSIRVLTLNDGEHKDSTLYRLEKDWILEFRLGPSLFGRKVKIFVNFPEKGHEYHRSEYNSLSWSNCSSHDDCAKFCQIRLHTSGSFHYYFTYNDEESPKGSGYFLVDPVLTAGGEELPLDCIQSVTYLSKLLGPFSSWENKLRVAKETGYNMIHFTPIQELGGSNSAYSLCNQLSLNVTFNEGNRDITYDDVTVLTDKLRNEWKVLSICDIVLNHTANESPWLKDHPECSYNLVNSPHLKPAYLLDYTLDNLSKEISQGKWEFSGIPTVVNAEEHLNAIKHALFGSILPNVKIFELFTMDIDKLVVEFQTLSRNRVPPSPTEKVTVPPLKLIPDPEFRRLAAKVDMDHALALYNIYRSDCFDEETRLKRCSEEFKKCLEKLNNDIYNKVQSDLGAAVENTVAGVRYFRVQHDGPRLTEISVKNPLFQRYFTDPPNGPSEAVMYSHEGQFVMAHNGWVMNADPLQNFAAPGSDVYLRRELIAWGDSVKLRYGEKPGDCPYLWNLMKEYVEKTVKTFDGVRLDNCHSTPIAVAQFLLDAGRRIKPNLYVVAELFTNSDDKDNIFVNKLGITSLIREAMSAWDSHEEGRLVYRYGGVPVGAFVQPTSRPLVPSVAHALFMDLTHDNQSPVEKRTVFDLLPSSGLVSMACCASGSNMGYDLLVPHHIHVVDESRLYLEWGNEVNLSTGIIGGKRALNNLHYMLGKEGYSQVFVDQVDTDIVCVTRHNDITHETVILVSYTAFHPPSSVASGIGKGVTVSGHGESVILEATLSHRGNQKYAPSTEFKRDPKYINGLAEYTLDLRENIDLKESRMLDFVYFPDGSTRVNFTSQFKPGSVVAVQFTPHPKVLPALQKLSTKQDLSHVISQLSLVDLNKALYCCAEEEGGTYDVPNFGKLVYAGLQGVVSPLSTIAPVNDLGHPLCANLRNGHWLMDYIASRLKNYPGTKQLGDCMEQLFAPLKDIPRFLVPSYFNLIIMQVYKDLMNQAWSQMSELVSNGSAFCKSLALGSIQLGGIVSSSPLPLLSSNLLPPKPPIRTTKDGRKEQLYASLSAGLPHFSHGYMRNWGRDTFIALRGLFLLTGRYQEARYIILAFGGCLRHGLIPNLLDGGNNPRYNCRDAVWWWLYTIQSYVELVPQGHIILNDVVNRIFPTDDSPNTSVDQPLHEVIQEAMSVHFQGLCFRERNAGIAIDAHMVSQGFDNQIGVNPNTGFVFGGNEWNCGTWMDKMGSSEKAGTKGRPATPRDGSAVELIGLSKAAVRWLATMNEKNLYPHSGVSRTNKDGSTTTWSYKEWNKRIQDNFEKYFWVSTSPDPNEKRPDLVNRKGIYKDTYGASQPWTDYQLRPNFPVAMVVAPELFTPSNALAALQTVEDVLLGPLGIKTLDPTDWCYNGFYDNSNDSSDAKVAHGFNYHQGPEWLWPVGFFLRAKLIFAEKAKGQTELATTISKTLAYLSHHYSHLQSCVWRGLPELTNKDGAFCPGSCTVQAWSMSTILEVLEDISKLEVVAGFEKINDPLKL